MNDFMEVNDIRPLKLKIRFVFCFVLSSQIEMK